MNQKVGSGQKLERPYGLPESEAKPEDGVVGLRQGQKALKGILWTKDFEQGLLAKDFQIVAKVRDGLGYYECKAPGLEGRIAVADGSMCSAGNPATTDNGLMVLDWGRPAVITDHAEGNAVYELPLMDREGETSSTRCAQAEFEWAVKCFDLRVEDRRKDESWRIKEYHASREPLQVDLAALTAADFQALIRNGEGRTYFACSAPGLEGRIAVAGDSMAKAGNPATGEDGLMLLDPGRACEVFAEASGKLSYLIPLERPDRSKAFTHENAGTFNAVTQRFGLRAVASNGSAEKILKEMGVLLSGMGGQKKGDDLEGILALGFKSREDYNSHQEWLASTKAEHGAAEAYQASPEAAERRRAAAEAFGIPERAIVWLEPHGNRVVVDHKMPGKGD